MSDVKKSLDITHGTTMAEPVAALSRVQSEVGKVNDYDPSKPYPTEEEFATLPRVPGFIPWTAWTVAIVEFAERFSYYGTTAVCKQPSRRRYP
jgi:POT family proton-dependent oligopeptide transporter